MAHHHYWADVQSKHEFPDRQQKRKPNGHSIAFIGHKNGEHEYAGRQCPIQPDGEFPKWWWFSYAHSMYEPSTEYATHKRIHSHPRLGVQPIGICFDNIDSKEIV